MRLRGSDFSRSPTTVPDERQATQASWAGNDGLGIAGRTMLPLPLRLAAGGGRQVTPTDRGSERLAHFITHAGQVISRRQLVAALWADRGGDTANVVDVYIGYLRRKLAPLGDFGVALRALRGRGFILESET